MNHYISLLLLPLAISIAAAQDFSGPVEAEQHRTGRSPVHDFDRDGWDDLWVLLFKEWHDGRSFLKDIRENPGGDLNGDGVSNYEKMLDFRNPYTRETPVPRLTPDELKARRVAEIKQARQSDGEKIERFQRLLKQRGVFQETLDTSPSLDKAGSEPLEAPATSCTRTGLPGMEKQMLCSGSDYPEVFFHERLSDGRFLLAWEGPDDRIYDIEGSDDLVDWERCGRQIPVVGGIGTWGDFTHAPKRFYRVVQDEAFVTVPSDPAGGDGVTTFGGTITPILNLGAPFKFTIDLNLPPGVSASAVELVIDGEVHSQCTANESGNTFTGDVRWWHLAGGEHTAYAIIHALTETTASLDPPVGGMLRTPSTGFTLDQVQHLAANLRVGRDKSPQMIRCFPL